MIGFLEIARVLQNFLAAGPATWENSAPMAPEIVYSGVVATLNVSQTTIARCELGTNRNVGKGRMSLRELPFMTVLAVFGGSGEQLALLSCVLCLPREAHQGVELYRMLSNILCFLMPWTLTLCGQWSICSQKA